MLSKIIQGGVSIQKRPHLEVLANSMASRSTYPPRLPSLRTKSCRCRIFLRELGGQGSCALADCADWLLHAIHGHKLRLGDGSRNRKPTSEHCAVAEGTL